MSDPIVFLDTECTSLDRRTRRIWDLAYIKRTPDGDVEHQVFINVNLKRADPASLKIGGYYDRHPDPYGSSGLADAMWGGHVAEQVAEDFRGAILVGAVPSFDEETLARLLFAHDLTPTWHYHLVDVETLAAGMFGISPPWDFDAVLARCGLKYDETARHTALGDARIVRDLYDKCMTRNRDELWAAP